MTKTQTITTLSPSGATAEVTAALAAVGLTGLSVSSSPQMIGRQGKVFLSTVVSKMAGQEDAALAAIRDLPDVCTAGAMGCGTVYIYRRMV